jgi:hypothetical protein
MKNNFFFWPLIFVLSCQHQSEEQISSSEELTSDRDVLVIQSQAAPALTCQEILDPAVRILYPQGITYNQSRSCKDEQSEQAQSQALQASDHHCGTDDILKRPEIREELVMHEEMIENGARQRSLMGLDTSNTIYTIPVVFHVIHIGEPVGSGTNISDAQIESAMTALNNHFRKVPGSAGDGDGVDVGIQFVLAKRDPNNNPHSGINRVNGSSVANYATKGIEGSGGGNGSAIEEDVKALSLWPHTQYVNIWVVSEIDDNGGGAGVQGYAYFPSTSTNHHLRDGIVILHSATGTIGSVKSYTNKGLTLIHEMGHVFSLYHTFNGTNSCTELNCNTGGDRVCDTPPTPQSGSCSAPSCNGTQQVENYMDYTTQTCQNMFSQGQKDRMRDSLLASRPTLLDSLGAMPVNNLDVALHSYTLPQFVCSAGIVPTVRISNLGSTTISSAQVRYRIDGGSWSNTNFSGSLVSGAIASVTLPSFGLLSPGDHSFEFNVNSPNGATDQSSANNTLLATINVPASSENINVSFTLDYFGSETSYVIKNNLGNIYSGGPFQDNAQGTVVNNNHCLPIGCFDVEIKDKYGDGQSFTSGSYRIINGAGSVLFTNTGNWGNLQTHQVCTTGATSGGSAGGGTGGAGGGGGGSTDTTLPTVSLTAPTTGSLSNGGTSNLITLTATASDNVGVTKVEFYYGSTLIAQDTVTPYSVTWNVASLSSGTHSLTAKAFDAAGNTKTSTAVSFILDKTNPTGSITSPANVTTLSGTSVTITASASDTNGIKRVEFYQGSTLLGQDTSSPYEYNWSIATLVAGTYTLSVKIIDNADNSFTPSSISVTQPSAVGTGTPVNTTFPGLINGCYTETQYQSFLASYGCTTSCSASLDLDGDGKLLMNDLLSIIGNLCHE